MAKKIVPYRNLSIVFFVAVVALGLALIWQVNKTATYSNKTEPISKQALVKDYNNYKESFVNLRESTAELKAKKDGFETRVVERDDDEIAINADLRPDRMNFSVHNGRVTKVEFY